jgi:hypothetical protein
MLACIRFIPLIHNPYFQSGSDFFVLHSVSETDIVILIGKVKHILMGYPSSGFCSQGILFFQKI